MKKRILHGQVEKDLFYRQIVLSFSARFWSSDRTIFRAFIVYFVCGGFQVSNPVGYRYLYIPVGKYQRS